MAFTVADINDDVRFYLGNLPTSAISDEDLNKIIQMQVDKYSLEDSDRCSVFYHSTVETLRWLIRQQVRSTTDLGGKDL